MSHKDPEEFLRYTFDGIIGYEDEYIVAIANWSHHILGDGAFYRDNDNRWGYHLDTDEVVAYVKLRCSSRNGVSFVVYLHRDNFAIAADIINKALSTCPLHLRVSAYYVD